MADPNHPDLQWLRTTAQTIEQTQPTPERVVVDITRPPTASDLPRSEMTAVSRSLPQQGGGSSIRSRVAWLGLAAGTGWFVGVAYTNSNLTTRLEELNAEKNSLSATQSQLASQKDQMERDRVALVQDRRRLEGDVANISVERQKLEKEKQELAKRETASASSRDTQTQISGAPQALSSQRLGFQVASLSDDLRVRWGIAPTVTGVVVINSDIKSASYQRGIRPGVIILQVASTVILSQQQFISAMDAAIQSDIESVWVLVKFGPQSPVWRSIALR